MNFGVPAIKRVIVSNCRGIITAVYIRAVIGLKIQFAVGSADAILGYVSIATNGTYSLAVSVALNAISNIHSSIGNDGTAAQRFSFLGIAFVVLYPGFVNIGTARERFDSIQRYSVLFHGLT